MEITPEIHELLTQLNEKYRLSGQDLKSYLQGLLVSDYEPYWDYILLDNLLSLQQPKTPFPDEMVFIGYHQITELYFMLILHEYRQMQEGVNAARFTDKLRRLNRYIENLTHSFDIMIDGMEHEQFLKFRMALLPASGFQSAGFRRMELCLTPLRNLLHMPEGMDASGLSTAEQIEYVYWARGAMDVNTGEKTLTLKQFEQRYNSEFAALADKNRGTTVYELWMGFSDRGENTSEMDEEMRTLDTSLNVNWRLSHYRSAVRYLKMKNQAVDATGGTNWMQYLPPRFQRIVSFPGLWTAEQLEEWGKGWVMKELGITGS